MKLKNSQQLSTKEKQSSKKKQPSKKGGGVNNICIQEDITLNVGSNLFNEILRILNKTDNDEDIAQIKILLGKLNKNITEDRLDPSDTIKFNIGKNHTCIFNDITDIVNNFVKNDGEDAETTTNHHFQTEKFSNPRADDNNKWRYSSLWGKYDLGRFENKQTFITIDPTIIQLLIFDSTYDNNKDNDIVYSLKLIIREQNKLCLRYTTQLFPTIIIADEEKYNSLIIDFKDMNNFGNFNKSLGKKTIEENYNIQYNNFIKQYIKFYKFYKKCYYIDKKKKLIDYQLKYISILGKARFGDKELKKRTAVLTDYVMGNLIFANPTYGFISGGYKGFKSNKFGITRSGYEIAKKYNRPILTIMCAEGEHDAHKFSDSTLIYGEHWGEDTIALSQLTDGAIVIAPFGGWTYVECLALLAKRKIVAIYNDFFNILNYKPLKIPANVISENNIFLKRGTSPKLSDKSDDEIRTILKIEYVLLKNLIIDYEFQEEKKLTPDFSDEEIKLMLANKKVDNDNNIYFFKFLTTEQHSIIDYYINYYIVLLYILCKNTYKEDSEPSNSSYENLCTYLKYGIEILTYLKKLIKTKNTDANFNKVIEACNILKSTINSMVNENLDEINTLYHNLFRSYTDYHSKIPKNCDGIWTKPLFDLTELCKLSDDSDINKREKCDKNSTERLSDRNINDLICVYKINYNKLFSDHIFEKLPYNIIFVFSDPLYLNMYLNENLNEPSFQKNMQIKINDLSQNISFCDEQSFRTQRNLNLGDKNNYFRLNRHLDGTFTADGELIRHNILREKYSFIIDDKCQNYTALLDDSEESRKHSGFHIPADLVK
jgi:hypothetical protein